jgi:hypothetical protein
VVSIVVDINADRLEYRRCNEDVFQLERSSFVFNGISSRGRVRTGGSTYSGQVEAMFSSILYRRWSKHGEALEDASSATAVALLGAIVHHWTKSSARKSIHQARTSVRRACCMVSLTRCI